MRWFPLQFSNRTLRCFSSNTGIRFKDTAAFLDQLKECSRSRDLTRGKELYTQAVRSRHIFHPYVANSLVNMFAKCRSMVDARDVFENMEQRDVVSWNTLLYGYVENGQSKVALQLFDEMNDCDPDARTYVAALTACSALVVRKVGNFSGRKVTESCRALSRKGTVIHSQAKMNGCCNVYVENSLISLYSECGNMIQARQVFDNMKERVVVTWNTLLKGYVENGESELALNLYETMEKTKDGCSPDERTFVAALTACSTLASRRDGTVFDRREWLEKGRRIHSLAVETQHCDRYVESILIDMYCKFGCMSEAREAFDKSKRPDIVSWNALLQGYVDNRQPELALEMFDGLVKRSCKRCRPDARTYGTGVAACVALSTGSTENSKWIERGRVIHSMAVSNRCCDLYLESMLVDMYAKGGRMTEARKVFDNMSRRDVVTWTSLLQGYVDSGEHALALHLFERMEASRGECVADARAYVLALTACASLAAQCDERTSLVDKGRAVHFRAVATSCCDIYVENSAVSMYSKLGCLKEARGVFDRMAHRNVVSWNCMLQGYVDNGDNQAALELMSEMKKTRMVPTSATFVAAITACGKLMQVERGRELHEEARRLGLDKDVLVATRLVDLYGKCGCMEVAKEVFDAVPVKDVWVWNTLICGYSDRGDTAKVVELLEKMKEQGVHPNEVTFTHALTACSHSGQADKGLGVFNVMSSRYGVTPDVRHYACVIDLLGRANRLQEALELVRNMPFAANAVIWRSLLGACKKWNNVAVAEVAYESLLRLDGSDSATYVLMANIFGSAGNGEEGKA